MKQEGPVPDFETWAVEAGTELSPVWLEESLVVEPVACCFASAHFQATPASKLEGWDL